MQDFDNWNTLKKNINQQNIKNFQEREVWSTKIGKNIGNEVFGVGDIFLRPVLILKKFSSEVFLGIPLTLTQKEGIFYYSFSFQGKTSVALLSQIRLFSAKRLEYKKGKITDLHYNNIKEKLIDLIQ